MTFACALVGVLLTAAAPQEASPDLMEARTIEGASVRGRWISLDVDGTLTLRTKEERDETLNARRVLSLESSTARRPVETARPQLMRFELVGGDVVFGEILDADFDTVRIQSPLVAEPVTIALERLHQAVVLENAAGLSPRFGGDVPQDRDVVFIRSKEGIDHVIGEVGQIARSGVSFTWGDKKESTFAYQKDRVVAVRLAAGEAAPAPAGLHAQIFGRDGSVMTGVLTRKAGGSPALALAGGAALPLREAEIVEIVFRRGDFVFLSELEPKTVVETPYLEGGLLYGARRDRSLDGGRVTIGETFFPKAVTMHSRCEATYALDGAYTAFTAAIGLDGAVAQRPMRGAVAFSVLVDGKVLLAPKVMRAGEEPFWITNLDLARGRELTLRADFADNFHFNGWAVWGGAALTKKTP
jgi:hypothetical protein